MLLSDGSVTTPTLDGHTAVAVGDSVVVYGGKRGPWSLNGETFAIDIETKSWHRLITSGEAPIARAYHTCCRMDRSLYFFGGITAIGVDDVHYNMYNVFANVDALPEEYRLKMGEKRLRDPSSLRRVTQQRQERNSLYCLNLTGIPSWSAISSFGACPVTRSHHSACIYKTQMYITGGYSCLTTGRATDEEANSLSDVHALELNTMTWTRIACQPGPQKIWGSASAVLGEFWVLHGGVDARVPRECSGLWIFHLDRGEWRQLNLFEEADVAMHTAARMGAHMMMMGGSSTVASQFHNRVIEFDLFNGSFQVNTSVEGDRPPPVTNAAAVVVGDAIWLIGGLSSTMERLGTVFAFDTQNRRWEEMNTYASFEVKQSVVGLRPVEPVFSAKTKPSGSRPLMVTSGAQTRGPTEDGYNTVPQRILQARQNLEDHLQQAVSSTSSTLLKLGTLDPLQDSSTSTHHDTNYLSVAAEVQARMSRMKDLQIIPSEHDRVHSHWKEELDRLHHEHSSWKERTLYETTELRNSTQRFLDVLPIHRRDGDRAVIEQVRVRRPVPTKGFVSPSIAKLGLSQELAQMRDR